MLQRKDGCVLMAKRPEGKPSAGRWEFPGGKIESNESPHQALARVSNGAGLRRADCGWRCRPYTGRAMGGAAIFSDLAGIRAGADGGEEKVRRYSARFTYSIVSVLTMMRSPTPI